MRRRNWSILGLVMGSLTVTLTLWGCSDEPGPTEPIIDEEVSGAVDSTGAVVIEKLADDSESGGIPCRGNEGCTPGYWKNHPAAWRNIAPDCVWTAQTPLNNDQPGERCDMFVHVNGYPALDGTTMYDALTFNGGSGVLGAARILLRAAVAAMLNAANLTVDYPWTRAEIRNAVNAALVARDRGEMLRLKDKLDAWNNMGCPLRR